MLSPKRIFVCLFEIINWIQFKSDNAFSLPKSHFSMNAFFLWVEKKTSENHKAIIQGSEGTTRLKPLTYSQKKPKIVTQASKEDDKQ